MSSKAEKCDQISVTFSEWVAIGKTAKNTSYFGYDLVHILGHWIITWSQVHNVAYCQFIDKILCQMTFETRYTWLTIAISHTHTHILHFHGHFSR